MLKSHVTGDMKRYLSTEVECYDITTLAALKTMLKSHLHKVGVKLYYSYHYKNQLIENTVTFQRVLDNLLWTTLVLNKNIPVATNKSFCETVSIITSTRTRAVFFLGCTNPKTNVGPVI